MLQLLADFPFPVEEIHDFTIAAPAFTEQLQPHHFSVGDRGRAVHPGKAARSIAIEKLVPTEDKTLRFPFLDPLDLQRRQQLAFLQRDQRHIDPLPGERIDQFGRDVTWVQHPKPDQVVD